MATGHDPRENSGSVEQVLREPDTGIAQLSQGAQVGIGGVGQQLKERAASDLGLLVELVSARPLGDDRLPDGVREGHAIIISPGKRTGQALDTLPVRVTGLDRPIIAGLPVDVAKEKPPDIAPPGFRTVWNWLRATSKKKKVSRSVLMKAGGFERTTWFVYQNEGSIAFNKLEAMVKKLGGTISTEVVLASMSAPRANTDGIETGTGADDVDAELDLMLQQLDGLDDLRRGMVLGQFKAALREALASPREPVAGKGLRAPGNNK